MKLLVVIVNYRITDLTIECLRSLEKEIGRVPGARVAVLENGTGPQDVERIRQAIEQNRWGEWARLMAVSPNRGFPGGNNVVIREALASSDPPEYVLLLNGDTTVEPHALDALVEFMDRHPEAGIAGTRLISPDGEVQGSPFRFPGVASELDRGLRLGVVSRLIRRWSVVMSPPPTEACQGDWVSGASLLIRRQVFDDIGLMDEGLFLFFDDVDYCWNARKAGWQVWFVPQSRVIHIEGASTEIKVLKRRSTTWFQSRRRCYLKNFGPLRAAMMDAIFIASFSLWRLRRWIQRKPDLDPPHMLSDSIRHSVLLTGFKVRTVPNPALETAGEGKPRG